MKWVTWGRVGIDRIGSAWLIRKYIDPEAAFGFVEYGGEVPETMGIPFDIPGCRLSHRRGHCTFYALLREHQLKDPVLDEIAAIIEGADCITDLPPALESSGLEAVCVGVRKFLGDDQLALEKGGLIYDALYAYLEGKKREKEVF